MKRKYPRVDTAFLDELLERAWVVQYDLGVALHRLKRNRVGPIDPKKYDFYVDRLTALSHESAALSRHLQNMWRAHRMRVGGKNWISMQPLKWKQPESNP